MGTTLVNAQDEIFRLFDALWKVAPTLGQSPEKGPYPSVNSFDDANMLPPEGTKVPWARFSMIHSTGDETSVSGRRYSNKGTIYAQIFIPKRRSDASHRARLIAQEIATGFKKHRGGVYLMKVRHNDVSFDGPFARRDVLCQFEWTEVRSILDG